MPGPVFQDSYGHNTPVTNGASASLVAGTAVAGAVGQITPGASPTNATISTVVATDTAGSFNFLGTYGSPAPSTCATVTFANGFQNVPKSVITTVGGGTSGHSIIFYPSGITANAFSVVCGGTVQPDNSVNYTCQYYVIP